MDQVYALLVDWRYACGVLFAGAFAGWFMYKHTPAPQGLQTNVHRLFKAVAASVAAKQAGHRGVEAAADFVGLHETRKVAIGLRQQRRRQLIGSIILAAAVLIPVYLYAGVRQLPSWIFGVMGVAGVYRAWKSW